MSMCNVIGVLGDQEQQMWKTFDAAVGLAQCEHARLTLVKTCEEPPAHVWVTPFAVGGAYAPLTTESPEDAARVLAAVAENVPDSMPVTTQVLGPDSQSSLLRLLCGGNYGALVASEDLIRHCRRLRRELQRSNIRAVSVPLHSREQSADGRIAAHLSSGMGTEDGGIGGEPTPHGLRHRWSAGLHPWHARPLAGADGKH